MKKLLTLILIATLTLSTMVTLSAEEYTVQSGDVLWKIAQDNNTTVEDIVRINNLTDPNLLLEGQILDLASSTELDASVSMRWSTSGFVQPESVLSIPGHKWLYVSNLNGEETGYISRMALDGTVDAYKWVEDINSPTGMGYLDGKIYVANTTEVVVIDIETATIVKRITSPLATNLNDLTISDQGQIFISDVVAQGRIFTIVDDELEVFVTSKELANPNGVFTNDGILYVGSIGDELRFDLTPDMQGSLFAIDMTSKNISVVQGTNRSGMFDGVAKLNDTMIVSEPMTGNLSAVTDDGLAILTTSEGWLADIFANTDTNEIYAPLLFGNTVVAYQYTEKVSETTESGTIRLVVSNMLSNAHNIDNFQMPVTQNYIPGSDENINNLDFDELKGHLSMTAVVTIDGVVAGIATETERVYTTELGTQANSLWLVKLNHPGLTGFFTVEQYERAYMLDAVVAKMMTLAPEDLATFYQEVPMTTPGTTIDYASGDLAIYEGGIFTEYNSVGGNGGGMILEITPAK